MDDTLTLALRADFRADAGIFGDNYLRITVSACGLAADGSPRNLRTDPYAADPLRPYSGLTLTAQSDRKYPDSGRAYSYGWQLGIATIGGWDVMPAETVAIVSRTLAKVSRALAADDAKYGRPATFGAYVARVAAALGCPVVIGRAGPDGTYPTGQWTTWSSGEAAAMIDDRIAQHRAAD